MQRSHKPTLIPPGPNKPVSDFTNRLSRSNFQPKVVLARFWQFLPPPGNAMRITGYCLNQELEPATKPEKCCKASA